MSPSRLWRGAVCAAAVAAFGLGGALLGWVCMTGGLLFFLLLYAIVSAIGWWANREYKD